MLKRWGPVLLVSALLIMFLGGRWYVDAVNRTHPAPWPMVQGDAGGSFATPAVFPDQPDVRWTYPLPSVMPFSPVIGEDGVVYVSAGHELIAVGPDGQKRWAWKGKGLMQWLALGRHGAIYAIEEHRTSPSEASLVALDAEGRLSWRLPLGWHDWYTPPLVGQGGVIYLSSRSQIFAIGSEGRLKWSREWHDERTWPVEAPGGGLLFIEGDELIALRPDGSLRWRVRLEESGRLAPLTVGADGRIYYRGRQNLYLLDAEGRVAAQEAMGRSQAMNLAAGEGFLQDGTTRWSPEATNTWREPVQPGSVGLLTYLDSQGNILRWQILQHEGRSHLILNDPQGVERWRTDDLLVGSLPAIGADGRICFAGRQSSAEQMALICIGKK